MDKGSSEGRLVVKELPDIHGGGWRNVSEVEGVVYRISCWPDVMSEGEGSVECTQPLVRACVCVRVCVCVCACVSLCTCREGSEQEKSREFGGI